MPTLPVILDTDMDTDCDDAGALAVLHALAGHGEAKILGVICDAPTTWGPPCIAAINAYYGVDVPVASVLVPPHDVGERYRLYRAHLEWLRTSEYRLYNELVATRFAGSRAKTWAGVSLYRKLLAAQSDGTVVVIALGLLTVLAALLDSGPDEFSAAAGVDLVRAKVKTLVTMGGGRFPHGRDGFNWHMDQQAAARVLNAWPGRLAVNEWGGSVLTGARLTAITPPHNPVRLAYETFLGGPGRTRPSWDQLTVLYGVRGAGDLFSETRGYRLEYMVATGKHQWQADRTGPERIYLGLTAHSDSLVAVIEDFMVRPPTQ